MGIPVFIRNQSGRRRVLEITAQVHTKVWVENISSEFSLLGEGFLKKVSLEGADQLT